MKTWLRRSTLIGFSLILLAGPSAAVSAAPLLTRSSSLESLPTTAAALIQTTTSGTTAGTPSTAPSFSLLPGAFSLTISPVRLVVGSADIGKVQKILVVNRGHESGKVTVSKRDFVGGIDGGLNYQENAPYGASSWVTLNPTSLTLAPGVARTVTATITAPAGAEPGDHQVAIIFLAPPAAGSGNVKISSGIGMPMFVTAPGPTSAISDTTALSNLHAPGFAIGGPITITATLHNTGNVHRDFRAPSPLTLVASGASSAFPDFTVPRDSYRNIATSWNPPFMCICHPSVHLTNGADVQISRITVIIFPWPLFAGALVVALLFLLAIKLARRQYRRSILKAASAMHRPLSSGDA